MPEKKEILIINVHSFDNLGDAALTLTVIQQLSENIPDSQFSMVLDDPESYSGPVQVCPSIYYWLRNSQVIGTPSWNLWRLFILLPACLFPVLSYRAFGSAWFGLTPKLVRQTIRAYLRADLIVCKPGGFLYSSGIGFGFILAIFMNALAILIKKPLYLYPQSVGPIRKPWECALLRWLAARTRLFMVRESISADTLRNCKIAEGDFIEIPDSAFGYRPETKFNPDEWLLRERIDPETPLLGITMISWDQQASDFQRQKEYETAIALCAEHFIDKYGGSVLIFVQSWGPFASQDDRIPARALYSRMDHLPRVYLIEEEVTPEVMKSRYGRMNIFIGTRMHSNIFALSCAVPVLAIEYYPKTRGIMRMMGLEEWVLSIESLDAVSLIERLDKLWIVRSDLRVKIRTAFEKLQTEAQRPGIMIATDYFELERREVNEQKPRIVQLLFNLNSEEFGGGASRFGIELALNLDPKHFSRSVWALGDFNTRGERENQSLLNDHGVKTMIAADWDLGSPYVSWGRPLKILSSRPTPPPSRSSMRILNLQMSRLLR